MCTIKMSTQTSRTGSSQTFSLYLFNALDSLSKFDDVNAFLFFNNETTSF